MRALIAILPAFMLFATTPASSVELQPLSGVLAGEKSTAIFSYAFTRCGGLYIMLAAVAHNAAPVQAKALRNQAAKAMLIAYNITKNGDKAGLNKDVTPKTISDQAARTGNLYKTRRISNRDATGHGSDAFFG